VSSLTIHPTAVVDPTAELAADVIIGPYSVVEASVRVGRGTRIGPHVHLCRGATLGESCEVHAGAVISDTPQVTHGAPQQSFLKIGNRVIIREYATLHRSMNDGGATVVGDDCFLMACSHVAHDCVLGNKVILVNSALLAGHVHVDDGVIISGNSVVHQFCRIGTLAFISGVAGVVKDVPPFMLADGHRATVRGLNSVGLRRAGVSAEGRQQLKRAYKILYQSGLNTSQALEQMAQLNSTPEVQALIDFVRASKRGIMPASAAAEQAEAD
jgi:UDP-N-acetylglucosamine acyltransferase